MNWLARRIEDSDANDLSTAIAEAAIDVRNMVDDLRRDNAFVRSDFGAVLVSEVGRVLFDHRGEIVGYDGCGVSQFFHGAAVQPEHSIADGLYFASRVRDEKNG